MNEIPSELNIVVPHNNADQGKNAGDSGLLIDKQRVNNKRALPSSNNKKGLRHVVPENNVVPENQQNKSLSNASTPSISRRSSVAKGTLPEPANLIPWPSQNSSSGQDYAENNRIEGKTGTLALPAPDNRTEEGNSRLALPAPQGNSENQRHQVEEGNIENSEPSSNDSTPSISRQSSISFDSNKYPTEEEEPNADATGTKNGEQETRKDSAPSENNGTNTNSSDQNFPRHYREEFGDFPSYDLSSPSSRRSSVSSANSKFSNADHQSDSGNESSSNNENGSGSTFSNHYNDSLFDN